MRKLLLVFCLLALTASACAQDSNNSVTVYPTINISIDGNSVTVSSGDSTFYYGDINSDTFYSTSITGSVDVNLNASICPGLSDTLNPLIEANEACVLALANDNNSMIDTIREDLLGDINTSFEKFASGIDGAVTQHLVDFGAVIKNTFVPTKQQYDDLDARFNLSKQTVTDLNAGLYACNSDRMLFTQKEAWWGELHTFAWCMFGVAVIALLVLVLYITGVFDKLTSGLFGG